MMAPIICVNWLVVCSCCAANACTTVCTVCCVLAVFWLFTMVSTFSHMFVNCAVVSVGTMVGGGAGSGSSAAVSWRPRLLFSHHLGRHSTECKNIEILMRTFSFHEAQPHVLHEEMSS